MSFTHTAREFNYRKSESDSQIISKMLGQNFGTEFFTMKAGKGFTLTFVCKH
jgi:hypothetical protein